VGSLAVVAWAAAQPGDARCRVESLAPVRPKTHLRAPTNSYRHLVGQDYSFAGDVDDADARTIDTTQQVFV
jgi:hypothetical protein